MKLDMPNLTVAFGASLIILGVQGYYFSGRGSLTALIPALFGVVLVALGLVARRAASTKHAMHAAAVLALIGILGSGKGVLDMAQLLVGGEVGNPLAAGVKSAMAIALAVFLGYCVRSFRQARKSRQ